MTRTASESMLRPTEYMGDHSQDSSKSDKRAKDEVNISKRPYLEVSY
jgi:hypothetical protein